MPSPSVSPACAGWPRRSAGNSTNRTARPSPWADASHATAPISTAPATNVTSASVSWAPTMVQVDTDPARNPNTTWYEDSDTDQYGSLASTLTNLRVGYKFGPQVEATLDVFNLLDKTANDIQYFYESQFPGEAAPVADRHVHAAEPRSVRVTLQVRF